MMLKTATFLFLLAVCAALPLDEQKDIEGVQGPPVDPQATEPVGDGSDLKTDSTFWGGYYRFPAIRRSYYSYGYRPRYYHSYYNAYPTYYHTYPTYVGTYW